MRTPVLVRSVSSGVLWTIGVGLWRPSSVAWLWGYDPVPPCRRCWCRAAPPIPVISTAHIDMGIDACWKNLATGTPPARSTWMRGVRPLAFWNLMACTLVDLTFAAPKSPPSSSVTPCRLNVGQPLSSHNRLELAAQVAIRRHHLQLVLRHRQAQGPFQPVQHVCRGRRRPQCQVPSGSQTALCRNRRRTSCESHLGKRACASICLTRAMRSKPTDILLPAMTPLVAMTYPGAAAPPRIQLSLGPCACPGRA